MGPSHFGDWGSFRDNGIFYRPRFQVFQLGGATQGGREEGHWKISPAQHISRPDDPVPWTLRRGLRDTLFHPSPMHFLSSLPHTCSLGPKPGAEEADLERKVTNLQKHACDTLLRTHTSPPNGHTGLSPSRCDGCIPSHMHRYAHAQI